MLNSKYFLIIDEQLNQFIYQIERPKIQDQLTKPLEFIISPQQKLPSKKFQFNKLIPAMKTI